jgi:hypothetical protein
LKGAPRDLKIALGASFFFVFWRGIKVRIKAAQDTFLKREPQSSSTLLERDPNLAIKVEKGKVFAVDSIGNLTDGHLFYTFSGGLSLGGGSWEGFWGWPKHWIVEGRPEASSGIGTINTKLIHDVGLISPKKLPTDFNFTEKDFHLIVNDRDEWCRGYDYFGKLLWEVPALARGQGGDYDWLSNGSDTPPGTYKIGTIYKDYVEGQGIPPYRRELMQYGWYSFDLIDLEGQETGIGRAGIMIHGGGSGNGWPGAWESRQQLLPTLGCVRVHNQDLKKILSLTKLGEVFVSVYQERR